MRTWFTGCALVQVIVVALTVLGGGSDAATFRLVGYAVVFALLAIAWAPRASK